MDMYCKESNSPQQKETYFNKQRKLKLITID